MLISVGIPHTFEQIRLMICCECRQVLAAFFSFINFEEARKKNMIVVMKNSASSEKILRVTDALVKKGMQVQTNKGVNCTVLGVLGDTYMVDKERVGMMNGVDRGGIRSGAIQESEP